MMKLRNNNKGFTMVELLAVIIILGLLAIISITAVQGIINKAKERYYKSQEDTMVMAMQNYLKNNNKEQPKINGQLKTIKLQKLRDSKYIDKVVDYKKLVCDENASYVQAFKYDDEIYYTVYLECPSYKSKQDTSVSNIDISASFENMINNLKNSKVTFKVTDDNKGIISYQYKIYKDKKLVYSSDVFDTKRIATISKTIALYEYTPGEIKLVVSATNYKGITITKTFKENSQDNEPPKCKNITGASNVWKEGTRTITVKCDDGNGSGCKREYYTYEFTGDVQVGYIKIEDKAGKTKNCPVDVYIDNNPPVLELKVYKKKKDANEKADNNVIGSVKTSNSQQIKNLTVTKNLYKSEWLNKTNYPDGVYIEASYNDISSTSNIEWKWNDSNTNKETLLNLKSKRKFVPKKKTGIDNDIVTEDGYRQGQIIATDQFGHQSIVNITIPLDRKAPTYTTAGESKDYIKGQRDIKLTCNDTVSKCVNPTESYSYNKTIVTDKKTIYDNAGNKTELTLNAYVDNTPPTCGATTNEGSQSSWTNKNKTITVTCTDENSLCKKNKFSKDFTSSKDKDTITIEDKVGNTTNCSVKVYIDKEKPVLNYKLENVDNSKKYISNYTSDTWTKYSIRRNFTPSDTGGSGIKETYYSSDNKTWYKETNLKDWIFTGSGVNDTYYKTVDNAGNESPVIHLKLKVDKDKPSCASISGNSTTWTKSNRTITVKCSDGSGSGCVESSIKKTYSSSKKSDSVEIKDGVGNKNTCSYDVYVDKDKPTLKYSLEKIDNNGNKIAGYPSGEWTKYSIRRNFTASDSGPSGIKNTYWSSDKKTWYIETNMKNWIMSSTGVNDAYFKTVDNAGNESDIIHLTLKVDKDAPYCNGVWGDSSSWRRGDATITVGCGDNGSGCTQGSYPKYYGWDTNKRTDTITIQDGVGNKTKCNVNVYLDNAGPAIWTEYGPNGESCGGVAGVRTIYKVYDGESGISYVGDWWGDDPNSFNPGYAINRHVSGVNEFTKDHHWSSVCTSVNAPGNACYRIKVYAVDGVGNESGFISGGCSYPG